MKFQIQFPKEADQNLDHPYFQEAFLREKFGEFEKTIQHGDFGFFRLVEEQSHLEECRKIYRKFADRTHFVHVGIGGSSLGPEMLIAALPPRPGPDGKKTKFTFINNIDPLPLQDCLENLDPRQAVFYIVSKSGGTAETMAAFAVLSQWLGNQAIAPDRFSDYFVFSTDPDQGDLKHLANQYGISCLTVPKNVGGRFSVLSSVGLFPALFARLSPEKLLEGGRNIQSLLLNRDLKNNLLLKSASYLYFLKKEKNIHQTVLMPYSSRLREFSFWFVQLWAESLGKKKNRSGKTVHEGLTPIPSVGATDQHSQLQLFTEGAPDKCILFLEVEHFAKDFPLKNHFAVPSLKNLSPFSMTQLLKAELEGTVEALKEVGRPFLRISLGELDEIHLGALLLYFESLTVLMGHYLEINPFDQPGVESSKKYAYQWLNQLSQGPDRK